MLPIFQFGGERMRKNAMVAVCIVCLVAVSFFSGLLISTLSYDNKDKPQTEQSRTTPLDNGRPYRKAPIIIPIDNGRPY